MTSAPLDGITMSQPTQAVRQLSLNPKFLENPVEYLRIQRKKEEWAGWVNREYSKCKSIRAPFERQWHINLAFAAGKQYVQPVNVATQGFRLITPQSPPWRVKLVINKIRVAARTEMAKLTSNKPIPVVLPATTEDEDFAAARVGEQILRSYFTSAEFQSEYRSFIWWGVHTGNAYLKSFWSASDIDWDAQNPPTPNPLNPNLPPIPAPVVMGKICVERVNPFHIYVPDLLAENIEKQPYVLHVTTRNVSWVESKFGFKPVSDTRAINSINEAASLITKGTEQILDSVLVKEIWLKPGAHPDFPQGGVLTIINDKCVQVREDWPLPFKEFPFYKYNGISTGGFYSDSCIVDQIPLQKEYNRTRSQMVEIKNLMGKPKIMYQKGSINPRQISSEPGQGIPYTPGFNPPIIIPGVEVPQSMHMELDRLNSDFDDISGQHEISRGNTPSQVTSGTAISFLQEQDDSKLADSVFSIEYCMQMVGKHYLKYVTKHWEAERLVKVVGKDNDYEVKHWKGSDLRNNTDVKIQSGSALPVSKAARQALITEFMSNGWINPSDGLDILELGGFEKVLEDLLVDKRQAQRENSRMSELPEQEVNALINPPVGDNGQPIIDPVSGIPLDLNGQVFQPQPVLPVNSWDNHEAHIHYHNQYRKSQSFEMLSEALKQNFELHVQAHQMALSMPQMGNAGLVANQELAPEGASPTSGSMPPPPEEGGSSLGSPAASQM